MSEKEYAWLEMALNNTAVKRMDPLAQLYTESVINIYCNDDCAQKNKFMLRASPLSTPGFGLY